MHLCTESFAFAHRDINWRNLHRNRSKGVDLFGPTHEKQGCTDINSNKQEKKNDKISKQTIKKRRDVVFFCLQIVIAYILGKGKHFLIQTQCIVGKLHWIKPINQCLFKLITIMRQNIIITMLCALHYTLLTCADDVASTCMMFFAKKSKQSRLHQQKIGKSNWCVAYFYYLHTTAFAKLSIKFEAIIANKYSKMHSTEATYFW